MDSQLNSTYLYLLKLYEDLAWFSILLEIHMDLDTLRWNWLRASDRATGLGCSPRSMVYVGC